MHPSCSFPGGWPHETGEPDAPSLTTRQPKEGSERAPGVVSSDPVRGGLSLQIAGPTWPFHGRDRGQQFF